MAGETSSDEKLLAAISYWGSILSFLPALIIFLAKRTESAYVKKHSLQALVLNILAFIIIWVILSIVGSILGTVTFGIGMFLIMLIQVVAFLAFLVYAVVLGIQVFQGDDPDIPYVTQMIQKNLGGSP